MRQDGQGGARAERRGFLKLAGLGAAGAVGVVAPSAGEAKAEEGTAAAKKPGKRGYRETPHVRKFYELARF